MSKDRELLRQALDALEFGGWNMTTRVITALRERLAQPDELMIWQGRAMQAERLIEKFIQPEIQPCAGRNCGSTNPNLHSAECFEDYEKATGMRAWQGLTDEEKAELDAEHGDDTLAHLDAIEAKLREKNA